MGTDRLRMGVIGLGWFGEIHCEAIIGIPNLELAALCTRTPDRLSALSAKFGVNVIGAWEGTGNEVAILVDHASGALQGACDPRRDGYAIGY